MGNTVKVGNVLFSQRECIAIQCLTEGFTNGQIAPRLKTTENVVKNIFRCVYDKTGMSTRLELALWWIFHTEIEGRQNVEEKEAQNARIEEDIQARARGKNAAGSGRSDGALDETRGAINEIRRVYPCRQEEISPAKP